MHGRRLLTAVVREGTGGGGDSLGPLLKGSECSTHTAPVTMLSPRAFLFTRPQGSTLPKSNEIHSEDSKNSRQRNEAGPRNARREKSPTSAVTASKTTISDPMVIPVRSQRTSSRDLQKPKERKERRQHGRKQLEPSAPRARDIHTPDSIPPAVAALLAVTAIPLQKSKASPAPRRNNSSHQLLTVDDVLKHTSVSEKELRMPYRKSPMDVLLSPPEDLEEDDVIESDTGVESSYISSRTISTESVPSLDDGSIGEDSFSYGTLATPGSRGKRSVPTRRLQVLSSPPGESTSDHPLSGPEMNTDELDSMLFDNPTSKGAQQICREPSVQPRKFTFKSNLTASLKALRYAARSITNITAPLVIPDDFLTISIMSIDPQVPFTDERMPPRLEDIPTPALRRYLNPTTNAPVGAHIPSSPTQTTSTNCTASIQMRTYRVSKSPTANSPNVISLRTKTCTPEEVFAEVAVGPLARQRDMRENSDFIRIAVMEMTMRKNGKLDDKVPGRARWALPPRKPSSKVYEIGEGGVPVRWIPINMA